MDPRILTPIPTPPAQRWREVRLVYLPRLLFAAGVALIAWLWSSAVTPSSIVAEAEVIGSELRSAQAGVLASLNATINQSVRAGEVIGHVSAANPRMLEATLNVIRAEVGMLVASDSKRIAVEFERLQLDWINQRVERAAMQGRLQQVEADIARAEPLHRAGLVTDEIFSQLKLTRDTLTAQAQERSKLIDRLEPAIRASAASDPQSAALSGESALAAAIKVQEAKIKLTEEQLTPLPLLAPIDGVVNVILRRPGEAIAAGEPILLITAKKPGRLAGYLIQPLSFDPKPGMPAEIRTRSNKRKVAPTTITQVGAALELITPTLLVGMRLPTVPPPETGLRVEFALPAGLELRPGEHVDVFVR